MKARKIPALLIALCMLISMLPAVPATTASAEGVTQTISFPIADGATYFGGSISVDSHNWAANSAETHANVIGYMNSDINYTKVTANDARFRLYYPGEYFALDFKVNKSGYYDIALELGDYDNYKMQVSTVIDGTEMNSFTCPGDGYGVGNNDIASLGAKYLSAGVHTLIVKMIDFVGTANEKMIFLKSIQLTERDDMPEHKNQTIVFGHQNKKNGYGNTYTLTGKYTVSDKPTRRVSIANSGWEIDESNTNPELITGNLDIASIIYESSCTITVGINYWLGFKFVVDAPGYYDISANVGQSSIGVAASVSLDGNPIGELNSNGPEGTVTQELKKGVYLNAGEHVFVTKHQAAGRLYLYGLNLTASEPVAETIALPFNPTDSGIDKSNVNTAKLADGYKWEMSEDNTVDLSASGNDFYAYDSTTGTGGNINAKVYENELLEFKFNAEVAGDYELILNLGEHCDYGGNMLVLVNGDEAGNIYGDDNTSAVGSNGTFNKGFGKVTLNKGENTIGFKGLAPDIVDGPFIKENQVGDVHLYLYNATFTPVDDVVVKGVEITCNDTELEVNDTVSVTAKVAMSDGSYDAAKVATALNMTPDIISYDAATGNVKALKAGTGLIEFTYTADNGVVYEKQIRIRVKDSNSAIFGTSYAYVRADASGSYTINLIGALDSIGFKAAGFEVWGNENRVADAKTTQVYKTITTKDGVKTPVDYGSTENGYIFFSPEVSGLKAGTTYTVKPYVLDENDNKIYHNDLTLVIQ